MSVHCDVDGPVLTITIDRPEVHNCVDGPTARALAGAWERLETDQALSTAVLTGAGDRAFSTGADLKALETLGPGEEAGEAGRWAFVQGEEGYLGGTRLVKPAKPVVAAIEGHCLAGGLELACLADLRVAGRGAQLGLPNRRWNVPLVDGGTQRLPRIVGLGRALELILTGRTLSADEANAWGLVNEVVDAGGALERAQALARTIAALPQEALLADRASVYEGLGTPLRRGLAGEAARGETVVGTEAFREGVAGFAGRT